MGWISAQIIHVSSNKVGWRICDTFPGFKMGYLMDCFSGQCVSSRYMSKMSRPIFWNIPWQNYPVQGYSIILHSAQFLGSGSEGKDLIAFCERHQFYQLRFYSSTMLRRYMNGWIRHMRYYFFIVFYLGLIGLFLHKLRYYIIAIEASFIFGWILLFRQEWYPIFWHFQICDLLVRTKFCFPFVNVQVEFQENLFDYVSDSFVVSFIIAKKIESSANSRWDGSGRIFQLL